MELKEKTLREKENIKKLSKACRRSKGKYEKVEDKEIASMKTGVMERLLNAFTSDVPVIGNLGTKLFGEGSYQL